MSARDFDAVRHLKLRLANLDRGGSYGLGAETDDGIVDLAASAERLGSSIPRDIDALLQEGFGRQVADLMARLDGEPQARVIVPRDRVRFGPLVTRPQKIICVGFNYRKHAEETDTPVSTEPPLFSKYQNALNRHGGEVRLPSSLDDRFDFETELVIVIGQLCHDIAEAEALGVVAGYSIGNDVSARTRQKATTQFGAGKWSDGFAPIGPWLTTADLVPDPNALRLQTWMNGEPRQNWTTGDMIFDCRKLIAYCSAIMTLQPGDVIFTGTPQGVILGETAPPEQRRWLRPGDTVVSRIETLGELSVAFV